MSSDVVENFMAGNTVTALAACGRCPRPVALDEFAWGDAGVAFNVVNVLSIVS